MRNTGMRQFSPCGYPCGGLGTGYRPTKRRFQLGKSVCVIHDPRIPKFAKYATALPPPPASCDWTAAVPSWPMDGNDTYGDCVPAAFAHLIQSWVQNESGKPGIIPTNKILKWYIKQCGPGDQGCFLAGTMIAGWQKHSFCGHKLKMTLDLNPSIMAELPTNMQNAIYLLGGCILGVVAQFSVFDYIMDPDVTVWDVPPGPQTGDLEGHAFPVLGYSTSGGLMWKLVSWGQTYLMTPAFVNAYCDEAVAGWAPKDWVKTGTVPNGFDKRN